MTGSLTPANSHLRRATELAAAHVALSVAAVAILVVELTRDERPSTDTWVHGVIIAATALLLLSFAVRASRGDPAGRRRLRISSFLLGIALVVVVSTPGAFPGWMRILEALSAACVLGVLVLVRRSTVPNETVRSAGGDAGEPASSV